MRLSEYGVHSLVVYPDMNTLRGIYSYYVKMQLEDNNEMSLPTKYDDNMKLKGFCFYHQVDFDRRLTEQQKQTLLEHHGKNLMVVT
jgi:hypothetical protein